MVFVLIIHMIKFVLIESLDQIMFIRMLQILNLKYSRHFYIINCISLELIIFLY